MLKLKHIFISPWQSRYVNLNRGHLRISWTSAANKHLYIFILDFNDFCRKISIFHLKIHKLIEKTHSLRLWMVAGAGS